MALFSMFAWFLLFYVMKNVVKLKDFLPLENFVLCPAEACCTQPAFGHPGNMV